ncbi:MAG: EAL domain-containing protein [Rhodoferax sp.]|uniref:EAL domain-containing protein n=1 Tax=Rhodoferax sp. TaxID=50421 RepID=UPI00260670C4|nr:EAL domain-containing protein [Rhodoferax sp.]MDD5334922.1 EAL domain-containing protein [Rhodoferax sp.]
MPKDLDPRPNAKPTLATAMKFRSILDALDLKAQIAIVAVLLCTGATWLLVHDLDRKVRDNVQEVLAAQQLQTTQHFAGNLDDAIKLHINALADAAAQMNSEGRDNAEHMQALLARTALNRLFNLGLFVISSKGLELAGWPTPQGRQGGNFADADFFREVIRTGQAVVGKPMLDRFTQQSVVNIGVPIKNSRNEVTAVLVGASQIAGGGLFGANMPQNSVANGDLHVLSPKDGLFVTSTDPKHIMQPDPAVGVDKMYDRYRQGFEGSGVAVGYQGSESLSSATRVASTGWLVMATLPTAVAFKAIESLRGDIYLQSAVACGVIALLLWLILYCQLRPLADSVQISAQIIDAMAGGREPLRPLRIEGSKEIRRLLASFNKLQQHIKTQNQALQEHAEQMRLAASVFEGTGEAIMICSPDNRIISVNRAFCKMTGYDPGELIGANPGLLKSGRQDRAFYQKLWASLQNTGQWQGEIWNRRKSGEIYPERLTISALHDEEGKVLRYIAIAADITKQKQAEAVIWQQANHDLLTKLPNRHRLNELMRQMQEKSLREGFSLAVLHIDLDRFKQVNDTLGHDAGDRLIVETARRISSCPGIDVDPVAHLGGDEFVVVLSTLSEASPRVAQVAGEILHTIAQPFCLDGEKVYISASIGIARYPADAQDVANLLKNADQTKYAAKNEGRNRYCYFTASMELAARTRMQLANDMRGALAADQFEVHYQPIVDLATGMIVKAEALLRWHHPERGMISPVEFIPIAEETGLISEIGDWVFREAAQTVKRWCSRCSFSENGVCAKTRVAEGAGAACRHQITVNKSPRQFFTGNTDRTWIDYLREHDICSDCITIEITEGLLLDQHPEVMEKLIAFRDAGIQIALDDFGTGYSAMSYLKKFDIDYLKIDRSFVRDIVTDPSDRAIAEAIIVMAHKLGLKVVAEGVETIEQRNLLAQAGCDYGQGYLFARPMPRAQFEDFCMSSINPAREESLTTL